MRKNILLLSFALLAACGEGDKKSPAAAGSGRGDAAPGGGCDYGRACQRDSHAGSARRLQAVRSAQVRARVEGVVEKRLFAEGTDIVRRHAIVSDRRPYLPSPGGGGRSRPRSGKAVFARYTPLLDIKAVSQQEFDAAQARVKQAEAASAKSQAGSRKRRAACADFRPHRPRAGH